MSNVENTETENNIDASASLQAQSPLNFSIDPFILSHLSNPRDRVTLLRLDNELERFMKNSSMKRLKFPPMTSFQRLFVHKAAAYFDLEHTVVPVDSEKQSVLLTKTATSKIPVLRFADLCEEPEQEPAKPVKIMTRPKTGHSKHHHHHHHHHAHSASHEHRSSNANTSQSQTQASEISHGQSPVTDVPKSDPKLERSLEEREADYERARARIFGDDISESSGTDSTKSPSPSPLSVPQQPLTPDIPRATPPSSLTQLPLEPEPQPNMNRRISPVMQPQQQQPYDDWVRLPRPGNWEQAQPWAQPRYPSPSPPFVPDRWPRAAGPPPISAPPFYPHIPFAHGHPIPSPQSMWSDPRPPVLLPQYRHELDVSGQGLETSAFDYTHPGAHPHGLPVHFQHQNTHPFGHGHPPGPSPEQFVDHSRLPLQHDPFDHSTFRPAMPTPFPLNEMAHMSISDRTTNYPYDPRHQLHSQQSHPVMTDNSMDFHRRLLQRGSGGSDEQSQTPPTNPDWRPPMFHPTPALPPSIYPDPRFGNTSHPTITTEPVAESTAVPGHIMELVGSFDGKSLQEIEAVPGVKQTGAKIKILPQGKVLAVFRTTTAAQEAANNIQSPWFVLKPLSGP
eukprot:c10010_g1_i1.p1 GENE.c10010_g1_i1~~c10010_g1_i1.p1  ORF type:complete len:619 (+),score=97.60 c10010_g1_i1:114-1970(+)